MTSAEDSGGTHNGRDFASQTPWREEFGGQKVVPGNIIIRQRGTEYHPQQMSAWAQITRCLPRQPEK